MNMASASMDRCSFNRVNKMRSLALAISVVIACISVPMQASAAIFTTDELGVSITMNGEIKSGDAERLASIFFAVKPLLASYYIYPNSLYLNSPGGDVSEAIRIAELVKMLGISVATIGDGKGACASSCFLIYAAALERTASGIDTLRAKGHKGNLGPLGVHRPYLSVITDDPAGANRQEQVMSDMRAYLIKASVGHVLIDKMMSHASNDIYWLNAEEIRALGNFSPGVEEQLISKCSYDARKELSLSAREYIHSSQSGAVACVRKYMVTTYGPVLNNVVDQMRTGWRPWIMKK